MTTSPAAEIIERSHLLHPTMLADCVDRVAGTHRMAFASMLDKQARLSAALLAEACQASANIIREREWDEVRAFLMADPRRWQSVLIQACKLQCLPMSHAIDAAEYESRKAA